MAVMWQGLRICTCERNLSACNKLSLCVRACTPVAIMVGNGVGAKNGIMFKTAVSLEQTGKMQTVALDKTGTITEGEPKVTDIITGDRIPQNELIAIAYGLERKSEHPLAKAVVNYVEESGDKNSFAEK